MRVFILSIIVACVTAQTASAIITTLSQVSQFDLPGPVGKRFDYLTIDTDDHYLLSAHLGAGLLYVIDLVSNNLIKTISDLPGIEGVTYIPGARKAYTSNWGDHTIGVVDLVQMKVVKKLPAEIKPDGSTYASDFNKVYVSDEKAKAVIVVDTVHDDVVKTLRFASETGMPQYDSVSKKVLVNLQDQNLIAVINPVDDTLVATYPVGSCQGNHGMVLDVPSRRAFLSCEGNDQLAVMNLDNFQIIAILPMAPGADVLKFDPVIKRIYAACYSGAISVFQEDDRDHFRKLEDFPVQPKVHSLEVDPTTHNIYVPEQEENGKAVSRMIIYSAVL